MIDTFVGNGYIVSDRFPLDVSKLSFELFATFHLAHELPLEDGHVRVQIDELEKSDHENSLFEKLEKQITKTG